MTYAMALALKSGFLLMTLFVTRKEDTLKLRELGLKMGYEILTCQMQYDAADRQTDPRHFV